ncbi:MAG: hypothetical protein EOO77_07925 [Oxalobacteraceae bacterium]|nr:MAG: hypothetical protein EOO77_07925 [Oxalobacteraceae bacterium]
MHSITYIGSLTDDSESVDFDGVTYERGEAVEVDSVHPLIADNPTFSVKKIKEEKAEDKADVDEKPKAKTTTRRKKAETETK